MDPTTDPQPPGHTNHPIRAIAHTLRPTLLAHRHAAEANAAPHPKTFEALGMAGMFRLAAPADVGGLELPLPVLAEVLDDLATVDATVAWCVWNAFAMGRSAGWLPLEVGRTVYADPTTYVGFSAVPAGRAEPVDGGLVVTGRWPLVSGCSLASWLELACVERGAVKGATHVVVPAAAATVHDTWHVSAMRGTGSHAVSLSEVFVPDAFCIKPDAAPRHSGPAYRIPRYTFFGPGAGAIALGVGESALAALKGCSSRISAMSGMPNHSRRQTQLAVGLSTGALHAARLGYRDAISRLWDDVSDRPEPPSNEATADAWSAALNAVEVAAQAVDRCSRAAQNDAFNLDYDLDLVARNMRALVNGYYERFVTFGESAGRHYLGLDAAFVTDAPIMPSPTAAPVRA